MTRVIHFLTFLTTKIIFKLFLNFEVYGKENLKEVKKGAIFISNHESYFDPFIISSGLSAFSSFHPIHYLTEESLFTTFLGKLARLGAPIPGYLKNGIDYAVREPIKILWKNHSVGIFHEWCYKKQLLVDRVGKLIVLLNQETNKPLVPIYIYGTESLTWKKIFTRQDKILIFYGKPFNIERKLSESEKSKQFHNALRNTKLELFNIIDHEEKLFWANYGRLYHHIEGVKPYKELLEIFSKDLFVKGKWLDLGSGSGGIIDLLKKNTPDDNYKIIATDFDPGFISQLKKRFDNDDNVEIKELNLCKKILFEENKFDGITANLVLPYIIHYEEKIGIKAFEELLEDIFKILKPGGEFRWSSPKKGVKFWKVFIASRGKVFGFDGKEQLFYGPSLLRQALKIQDKGKRNIYHFLDTNELNKLLSNIGFIDIKFSKSMARQVNVISCKKPLTIIEL